MSKPNAGNESAEMDFWSHFAALRPHLVRGAAAVVVIAVAAFFARHFLIDVVLFGPKSAGFPTNRLLLETDCPYMAPVPFRGKRNDSVSPRSAAGSTV